MKKRLNILLILLLLTVVILPSKTYALDEEKKEEETASHEAITTTGEEKESEEKKEASEEYDYKNPDTGYSLIIRDNAGLLSEEELIKLKDTMIGITKYGHVGFITIDSNSYGSTTSFARDYSHQAFGPYVSSTLFVIDMYYRQIYIFNNGDIEKKISANKSEVITDNTFRYATRKEYYTCANETYKQIFTLLEGGKINEPMRHISNVVMAIAISFIIGYLIVSGTTKMKKEVILKNYAATFALANANATFIGDHKVYVPPSSSSGGGSSGGGGGGGGGGGSGGGHGF